MEGHRVVLGIYAIAVAVSAGVGAAVPVLLPEIGQPRLLGLLALPATPVGYSVFGGATTALLLGVGLLFIEFASRTAESE